MTKVLRKINKQTDQEHSYSKIRSIDGQHPLQNLTPGLCVNYRVRPRKNAEIRYFNFELAKEMGLLAKNHPEEMNEALKATLIETFAIQIVNEHDLTHARSSQRDNWKPNVYMATRYLQLQHPNRVGKTSGDGRSIWNGRIVNNNVSWDISSCGTGATCLSPASAIHKKFFRTGDPSVSYGCGYSEIDEGFGNAIFAEILHKNGIPTERTLLVMEFENRLSVNVRAAKCLIRPSHFFVHLKQNELMRLKAVADTLISDQLRNKAWPKPDPSMNLYDHMLNQLCKEFATMAARFESEYIFCWLEWDGDNILCDGSIIDYGSIRQFGLYHHEYRYDDVERWSTTISEQRKKTRYVIQQFAQAVYYLKTGTKRNIDRFSKSKILKTFDRDFKKAKLLFLLKKIGYTESQAKILLFRNYKTIEAFERSFSYFEKATSLKGPVKTADGITTNAIFCMRDLLREFPKHVQAEKHLIEPKLFMKIIKSKYCTAKEAKLTPTRVKHIKVLEKSYRYLITQCAKHTKNSSDYVLAIVAQRSLQINQWERVTGDSMSYVQNHLLWRRRKISLEAMLQLIQDFVSRQMLNPDIPRPFKKPEIANKTSISKKIVGELLRIIRENRHGM